jgi:decaprenylphospho-beta-D-erythro-pentofuranosid-2-ulose 2-reductase
LSNDIILILGARSDIAMAVAHRFAKAGYDIQLAARNIENLADDKSDLELRYGVSVSLHEFDALEVRTHELFVENLCCLPSVVVCAVGYMGNQLESECDSEAAARVVRSNFEGPASILAVLANKFEQRGSGCLVGISSVAGERGRATNYVYGSAKAGFTEFLSGLRNRLVKKNVHVLTVLPGFVKTKMTSKMDLPKILLAEPDGLSEAVFRAYVSKRNVIYHKKIWFFIMRAITIIPENWFKHMKL